MRKTFPIVTGDFTIPADAAYHVATITATNTANNKAATVTITDADGTEVWSCSLGPLGAATLNAFNGRDLAAGPYHVAVTGSVTGTVTVDDQPKG